MAQMQTSENNPWPGSQLTAGKVFFWASVADKAVIFRGQFDGYGESVKLPSGHHHPSGKFSEVAISKDYGKTWENIEAITFSTNNQFYTNSNAVARILVGAGN